MSATSHHDSLATLPSLPILTKSPRPAVERVEAILPLLLVLVVAAAVSGTWLVALVPAAPLLVVTRVVMKRAEREREAGSREREAWLVACRDTKLRMTTKLTQQQSLLNDKRAPRGFYLRRKHWVHPGNGNWFSSGSTVPQYKHDSSLHFPKSGSLFPLPHSEVEPPA